MWQELMIQSRIVSRNQDPRLILIRRVVGRTDVFGFPSVARVPIVGVAVIGGEIEMTTRLFQEFGSWRLV